MGNLYPEISHMIQKCLDLGILSLPISLQTSTILRQLSLYKRQIKCPHRRARISLHPALSGRKLPVPVTSAGPKRSVVSSVYALYLCNFRKTIT